MIPRIVPPEGSAVITVQAQTGRDFSIPAPQNPSPQAPALPGASLPEGIPQTQANSTPNPFGGLDRAPTTIEIALGAGALVVLAILFLFVRQGVRTHLVNRRAALDAAAGASWMLFAALMLTAAILVTVTVGRLWQAWAGLAAGFALCLILFCAALVLILRAPERRR